MACIFDLEPALTRHGTAAVSWTVNGRSDAAACAERAAPLVRIVVRDDDDVVDSDTVRDCVTFGSRFVLHQGAYTVQMGLLDQNREPIAAPRDVTITIKGGHETRLAVDLVSGTILY